MTIQNKHIEYLKTLLKSVSTSPGVYQYYDESGKIIYVGKAKNLKKRVSSYFAKVHDSAKTNILVRRIADIKFIVVDSEEDALLLENNLIKKYQPRYNVLLKDDKSYPWICIKNEPFPRILKVRQVIKDGSSYFGPYTSIAMVNTLVQLISELYTIRRCNLNLAQENIAKGKFKVCLEYHIGNCLAPCEGKQTIDDYNIGISHIKDILRGNISSVKEYLKTLMLEKAENLKFEEAQIIKNKFDLLEKYQSKSTIVSPTINNVDVFSIVSDSKYAFVNFIKVVNGAILQAQTIELKKRLDETDQELLNLAIVEIRQRLFSTAREILVPIMPSITIENVNFSVPLRGDKKKLLELSDRNVKYYRIEQLKQKENLTTEHRGLRVLKVLQKDLRLEKTPIHIECFDNSNLQGTNAVAACVVFKNGRPSKRDYRHFNIKTVEGPDDFASMKEIVYRRYKRLLESGEPLPQLIIVDGGKGQLGVAVEVLIKLDLIDKIAIVGIAKRLEEIFKPGDPYPLYLDKTSESLKIIQHLRDEAHRFGITFHRQKRSNSFLVNELDGVPGLGAKSIEKLLTHFKSVKRLKEASKEEISGVIGVDRTIKLLAFFKQNQQAE